MEELDSNGIQMELKYCERCGALWLRLRGSDLIFCPSCAVILAGIARDPRFLEHRRRSSQKAIVQPGIEETSWSEGGNA
ncbi:MAG TPA: hypothetical protein VH596_10095 [Terriglobales bacterium]|jgi:ribosomal protein S27AE